MRDKSDENWRVAKRCLDDYDLNAAANRFYYSVFQAVLLYAKKKKGYLKSTKSVHYDMEQIVKDTGKHGRYYSRQFKRLKSYRETADYDPETPEENKVKNLVADSEKMRRFFLGKAAS